MANKDEEEFNGEILGDNILDVFEDDDHGVDPEEESLYHDDEDEETTDFSVFDEEDERDMMY